MWDDIPEGFSPVTFSDVPDGFAVASSPPSWRSEIMSELDKNPATKMLAMQMLDTEGGGAATMEALVNRTAMIRQRVPGWSLSDELNSGFYGPIKRGYAQTLKLHPGTVAIYQKHIDAVRNGSNIIQGRTDQGSKNDPNVNGPGRVHVPGMAGEVYNYWTGRRRGVDFSHGDSARFAEQALRDGPKFADTNTDSAKRAVVEGREAMFSDIPEGFAVSVGGQPEQEDRIDVPELDQPIQFIPNEEIKGKTVKMRTVDPETGDTAETTTDAAEAQGLAKRNIDIYSTLIDCLET